MMLLVTILIVGSVVNAFLHQPSWMTVRVKPTVAVMPSYRPLVLNPSRPLFAQAPTLTFGDEYELLRKEYQRVTKGKGDMNLKRFLSWHDIRQMIDDGIITTTDIRRMWKKYAEEDASINEDQFMLLNKDVDEHFNSLEFEDLDDENEEYEEGEEGEDIEDEEGEEDDDGLEEAEDIVEKEIEGESEDNEDNFDGLEDMEIDQGLRVNYEVIWDPQTDSSTLFDKDFQDHFREFFMKATAKTADQRLTYPVFRDWSEVKELMQEVELKEENLQSLWQEAVEFEHGAQVISDEDRLSVFEDPERALAVAQSTLKYGIGFDSFLRLCYRIDDVVGDIQQAVSALKNDEVERFYREQFRKLTAQSQGLLTYNRLLQWPLLKEILDNSENKLDLDWLQSLWVTLPMVKTASGERAIDEDTFVLLNESIEQNATSIDISDEEEEH